MKIAMIGQKGIPSRTGGVEIHVEEIARRLVEKGHSVDVYCRKSYCELETEEIHGIKLKYMPTINTKHLDAITYTFLASLDALFNKYDIVHYHALGPSSLSFIPKVVGKKIVCTIHGLDWQREKWGNFAKSYLKFGEFATTKFANKVITVSNCLRDYYLNQHSVDAVFIPNGVNMPDNLEPRLIQEKYGLTQNDYILFLARLVPEKGVHYLIDAYNQLDTDKKLVIVGGSSHTDDYVSLLHEKAKNNPNIVFTGFLTGDILAEFFSNAYLYVLPSEIEGLPISLLEAMSYKQCCLVSNIPENLEVIQEYGFSFENKNIEDLKNQLKYLLDNPAEVKKIREHVKKYVGEKYNWDPITDLTEQVYKALLK